MFEIGDKVIYQGADKAAYRREGTVVSIEDKDGKPQLTVELDGGETFTAPIDDWSRKFNNACTSTNSVVRNAMAAHGVARNAEVAKNHRDGYNGIIQSFNKIVEAYFDVERAIHAVPDAKTTLIPSVKRIYKTIADAHADLKKWDAQ